MIGAPFATVADVRDRTRALITDSDVGYVATLLDDASVMIRGQFRSIDADIEAGTVDAESVMLVVARMVKRVIESGPDGVKSDAAGPFSVSYDNPAGNLYLTSTERALLSPVCIRTAISAYQ